MTEILQKQIPHNPLEPQRLPGIAPLAVGDWLTPDDAFAAQMAERERLIGTARDRVLMLDESGRAAAEELLETVLDHLYGGVRGQVARPDGARVEIDWADPLGSLGRITQQDFCLLQKSEGAPEHILTGAVLCFPASWTLSEKFMRPLTAIHVPVDSYDAKLAARVQRLFDGVQVGRPLWRFNALWYHEADLHHPRSANTPRPKPKAGQAGYLRSEKQTILRLPRTRAVIFGIHTFVLRRADVLGQWADGAGGEEQLHTAG
ncbi:heme-dependent oxidative N-demethylase family protein [Phycobacter sp. K97]|uniref:heme-dependent oxidative N-demethylase family protein n=1 Tax=Phycobacter sedimenti TaxID=3133977 RepID=UPI00311FAD88